MNNIVDEIKQKVDIVDFIGSRISLKKAGRNFKANCPFHSEKTPSFVISPERQIWHCFGACQDGGDIIKFLTKYDGITFYEALRDLAEKAGVKLEHVDFEDQTWKLREKLFNINELAQRFYNFILEKHKIADKARQYVQDRQINEKIVSSFGIGYAPDSWDSLFKYLKSKGVEINDVVKAGLVVKSARGSYFDRFRQRIMFPLKDSRGNILGFSGRLLDDKGKEAKYINTPETEIYHKRETLFGIDKAKEAIVQKDCVYIVEGEFDLLSLFRIGIGNVVAIKGSAVTKEQLNLISRFTKRIIFALDVDTAGEETTRRAIAEAEQMDFDIEVVSFDFAKDPDEAINTNPEAFKKVLKKPKPIYDYIIENSLSRIGNKDVYDKKKIGENVVPFLVNIQNPIVKSHYISKLANLISVTPQSIESLLNTVNRKQKINRRPITSKTSNNKTRSEMLEQYLLSILFQGDDPYITWDKMTTAISKSDFETVAFQKLIDYLEKFKKNNKQFELKEFINTLPNELKKTFDEIYLFDSAIFDKSLDETRLEKLLYEFKKIALKRKIKIESEVVEETNDNKKLAELLSTLSYVEKKLSML